MENLDSEQKEKLEKFHQVTGLSQDQEAIQLLTVYDWNLESAILSALDMNNNQESNSHRGSLPASGSESGSGPGPGPGAGAKAETESESDNYETTAGNSNPGTSSHNSTNNHIYPSSISSFLFRLVTLPVVWGYRFLSSIFSFGMSFFSFNSRINSISPRQCSMDFISELKTKYQCPNPPFFIGAYTNGLETAKNNLQYYLVVLQSDSHDDTPAFCRETLANPAFIDFVIQKNILLWGGNIRYSEAFKVATTLGAAGYPFMALIAFHEGVMKVVHRFYGISPPQEIIDVVTRISNQLDPLYVAIRAERCKLSILTIRANRVAGRSIRQEQDEAYQLSLKADREKAAQIKAEKENEMLEAQRAQEALDELEVLRNTRIARRKELAENLIPEPTKSSCESVTRMNIRLPSGNRLIRKFDADSSIKALYDFVESNDLDPIDIVKDVVIVNTYPRKEYLDKSITFKEAGLFPNATVLVEEADDDLI